MKEKPQPPVKQERPRRDTDYPERHPSNHKNEVVRMMTKNEIDEWWEMEKMKTNVLNLGS